MYVCVNVSYARAFSVIRSSMCDVRLDVRSVALQPRFIALLIVGERNERMLRFGGTKRQKAKLIIARKYTLCSLPPQKKQKKIRSVRGTRKLAKSGLT